MKTSASKRSQPTPEKSPTPEWTGIKLLFLQTSKMFWQEVCHGLKGKRQHVAGRICVRIRLWKNLSCDPGAIVLRNKVDRDTVINRPFVFFDSHPTAESPMNTPMSYDEHWSLVC